MTMRLPSTLTTWWSSAVFRPPEPMFLCFYVHRVVSACGAWLGRVSSSYGCLDVALDKDLSLAAGPSCFCSEPLDVPIVS